MWRTEAAALEEIDAVDAERALGERVEQVLADGALDGPRAVRGVVSLVGDPAYGVGRGVQLGGMALITSAAVALGSIFTSCPHVKQGYCQGCKNGANSGVAMSVVDVDVIVSVTM